MDPSEATYNVVIDGKLQPGFDPQQVKDMFGTLFKVPPEKTANLLDKRRVLKRDVDIIKAGSLKSKLERIGLVVTLEPSMPLSESKTRPRTTPAKGLGLSLLPMEKSVSEEQGAVTNTIICPKCDTEQPSSNEQCQGCGVYLHKVISRDSEFVPETSRSAHTNATASAKPSATQTSQADQSNRMTMIGIVASLAAALVGALLWKGIAMSFGYEFGIIAWGIGGAIGFAMAATGGRGQTAAYICGILALLAIMGGKYMVISDLQSQVGDILSESSEAFHQVYENELKAAQAYTEVDGEQELRQFMVDYGYSDAFDAKGVSQDEITAFQEEFEPRLTGYATAQPDYEEWYQNTIEDGLKELTPMGLMKDSFGLIDILFLFLGISTAARLGYGSE